jgi:SAM-dependent methyltransferase
MLQDTGEHCIVGKLSPRMMADHIARYRFAQEFVKGKDVLDIACGTGYGSALLLEAGAASVTGMDISEEALRFAREKYGRDGITFRQRDVCSLESPDSFDFIVSFETLEHVSQYREALRQLHLALRPGGTLILSTPNRRITSPFARTLADKPANPFHTQEFVPEEVRSLIIDAGFQPQYLSLFGQRQQRYFSGRLLRALYKLFFDPSHRSSLSVMPVTVLHPRYFLFVAKKS